MACLRPSSSGRRLSELLEEKQEPFFLDLHLLEKGCSGSLLDGYDTALCSGWPAPSGGNDAASVLRRLTSKKTKKKKAASASSRGKKQPAEGSGLLRLLLSKILHGNKAASRTLQCSESESFKSMVVSGSSPCSKHHLESVNVKLKAADATEVVAGSGDDEGMEYSDSDDDEKQLSPVSVLENPFEMRPPPLHGSPKNNAMAIVVRELLLEAAYTPALLTTNSNDLILNDAAAELDHDNDDDDTVTTNNWETHREELVRVSALVMSEVPTSRLDNAAAVQPERRNVGAEVEAAVLEALLRELVVDLGSC